MSQPTNLVVFVGPPRTGKTTKARQDYGDSAYWLPPRASPIWAAFSDYDGQKVLVLDEFNGYIPIEMLLRWISGADITGTDPAEWDTVVIISNRSPEHWWDGKRDQPTWDQYNTLMERIRRGTMINFGCHHSMLQPEL